MKFIFINDHRREFPVVIMCDVLLVSASGFYRWCKHPVSKRQLKRDELIAAICQAHEDSRKVYGSPRIHQVLKQSGRTVSRNTVAKLMKQQGIKAKTHKRFRVRSTDSNHDHPIAPNLLNRNFTVEKLNQVWLTDITYIPTDEGFLYLAGVMDLCSRRIIGWSMADHMRAELVCDALSMALAARLPKRPDAPHTRVGELMHHSDRGVQYACHEYQSQLKAHGITISMSGVGNCYDNAPQESLWGKLKTELVHHQAFATHDQARAAIFEYIEVFYNRQRLHSSIGYVSPERFEASMTGI